MRPSGPASLQVADRPDTQPRPFRQLLLRQPGQPTAETQPRPERPAPSRISRDAFPAAEALSSEAGLMPGTIRPNPANKVATKWPTHEASDHYPNARRSGSIVSHHHNLIHLVPALACDTPGRRTRAARQTPGRRICRKTHVFSGASPHCGSNAPRRLTLPARLRNLTILKPPWSIGVDRETGRALVHRDAAACGRLRDPA